MKNLLFVILFVLPLFSQGNTNKVSIQLNWLEEILEHRIFLFTVIVLFVMILFLLYRQYMLNKSINYLDKIMNSTMEATIMYTDGKITKVNQVFLDMYKYDSIEEVLDKSPLDLVDVNQHEYLKEHLGKSTKPYSLNMVRKDKSMFPGLAKGTQITNNLRLSSVIDLTELNMKDKLLFEQSKLASMGEMIGNIAHQWRQPLSVISTAATAMKMQKEHGLLSDEKFDKSCDTINNNAQYLSKTIDDFRNFIKGERNKELFILKNNIDSFLSLVESTIKSSNIDVIINLQEDIQINGYQNELNQCLINIFNNAKDALNENTSNEDKRLIFISTYIENNSVIIKIKDNASGIPETVLPRIFEPYFTTKEKLKGTGLGLHMTYNLVVDGMKGSIDAQNINYEYEGISYKGAQFIISMPMEIQ